MANLTKQDAADRVAAARSESLQQPCSMEYLTNLHSLLTDWAKAVAQELLLTNEEYWRERRKSE